MTTLNIPVAGNQFRKLNAHFEELKVISQEIPDRTLKVNPGVFWRGTQVVEFKGAITPIIDSPTVANTAKFVIIAIDHVNKLVLLDGEPSNVQAELPIVPHNYLPLAAVYMQSTTTAISQNMVLDLRPFLNVESVSLTHSSIQDRNYPDQHSIDSITGLATELTNKANKTDVDDFVTLTNLELSEKANIHGTNELEFQLNRDHVGIPSSDCMFSVNRGSLANVAIRWNESENTWQYTNDGSLWRSFDNSVNVSAPGSDTTLGLVKLSVESSTPLEPVVVEINDPRLFTVTEKSAVLDYIANSVTSVAGKTGVVSLNKSDVGLDQVDNTSDINKPISNAVQLALNGKVDSVINKQLSTEDYTTEEKNKLNSVEPNAQVNTVISVAGKTGVISLNKSDIGLDQIDNTSDINKPISTAVQLALNDKVDSVAGKTGIVSLDKSDVGLDQVDNTSDADKPISTAVQAELDKFILKNNIVLTDKSVPENSYRIEIDNGVIIATLVE